MGLYTQSTFCIMAPGWLPARRAAFDALLAGCIPVMLDHFLSKQASGGEGGREGGEIVGEWMRGRESRGLQDLGRRGSEYHGQPS